MDQGLSKETWKALRQEARRAEDEAPASMTEQLTQEAMEQADLSLLPQLAQRLKELGQSWQVHRQPLETRIPVLGPLLRSVAGRLLPFLLQRQVAFNAQVTRALQELYRAQRLLSNEHIARTDELFTRLEERIIALEARLRDLEEENARLRQGS